MDKEYLSKFIKDSWKAFRPFSLTLAIGSTTLGIIAADKMGYINWSSTNDIFLVILITVAGLLAQSGANLVNDYFEGSFRYYRPSGRKVNFLGVTRTYFDIYVFLWAMCCFALASLIGLYLIYITDFKMFIIGLIGIFGAYAYTGEPFVFKRKGLGVPISFITMGPLMVLGASYPFTKSISIYPILLSLPASFLIPALMISNEMRDFKRDANLSLGTLSVRIGSKYSTYIYRFLVFGSYFLTLIYVISGFYPITSLLVFLTFPIALKAHRSVCKFEKLGIPYTNNLHWTFTLILILALFLG
ncbi:MULTISPECIES: UbiA family prenyltransferase [Clostridium]|uniref:UbiA family prenyltransferase n=2 Tax=Clostridiaceae TaxID=31979 RepID=UPI00189805E0|nr:prenyltransferase [Clostridium tertium]MDI9218820.1 prenyltransferase [Clostridium tertium]